MARWASLLSRWAMAFGEAKSIVGAMPRQRTQPTIDDAAADVSRDGLNYILRWRLFAMSLWVGLTAAFFLPSTSDSARAQTASSPTSAATFEKIASILRHPRCLNCHQLEVPLQGDRQWQHIPKIGRNAPALADGRPACARCHAGDGPATGIPGRPGWRLPPIEAAWEGLTTAQLCQAIKSPRTNGGRDLPELIKHLDEDTLVLWAWEPAAPGVQRTPPPISHKEFVDLARHWVTTGAACPER